MKLYLSYRADVKLQDFSKKDYTCPLFSHQVNRVNHFRWGETREVLGVEMQIIVTVSQTCSLPQKKSR